MKKMIIRPRRGWKVWIGPKGVLKENLKKGSAAEGYLEQQITGGHVVGCGGGQRGDYSRLEY